MNVYFLLFSYRDIGLRRLYSMAEWMALGNGRKIFGCISWDGLLVASYIAFRAIPTLNASGCPDSLLTNTTFFHITYLERQYKNWDGIGPKDSWPDDTTGMFFFSLSLVAQLEAGKTFKCLQHSAWSGYKHTSVRITVLNLLLVPFQWMGTFDVWEFTNDNQLTVHNFLHYKPLHSISVFHINPFHYDNSTPLLTTLRTLHFSTHLSPLHTTPPHFSTTRATP